MKAASRILYAQSVVFPPMIFMRTGIGIPCLSEKHALNYQPSLVIQ